MKHIPTANFVEIIEVLGFGLNGGTSEPTPIDELYMSSPEIFLLSYFNTIERTNMRMVSDD